MSHLNTLTLHRYRYGELDEAELATLRTHLADCERCSARLAAQENNRAAFELTPVPDFIKDLSSRQAPRKAAWWTRWQVWLAPALGLAAALLIALPTGPSDSLKDPDHLPPEVVSTKGVKDVLEAWLETDRGPRPLAEGATVGPGSRIQLRYRKAPEGWVTFAGSDGSGDFEVYGTWPTESAEEGWQTAPFALTLDETPGIQKFYAVFTSDPPAPETVEASLRQDGAMHGAQTQTISLTKAP